MAIQDVLREISERVRDSASVSTIYGEPVSAEGKTVIPAARVRYGFGGGGGTQEMEAGDEGEGRPQQEGGGGAGGVEVTPVGMIEITAEGTRYVSFVEKRRIIRAVVVVALVAIFLLRKRLGRR